MKPIKMYHKYCTKSGNWLLIDETGFCMGAEEEEVDCIYYWDSTLLEM